MNKRHVILDGSKINSENDFHKLMAELLDFGSFYGENLDALWDMMSGGMGDNVILHWVKSQHSKIALGESCYENIILLFHDVKEFNKTAGRLEKGFDYLLE